MNKKSEQSQVKAVSAQVEQNKSTPEAFDVGQLAEANHANLQTFLETNEAVFGAMATMNQEVAAFASRRLQYNIARSEALMKCSEPEDLLRTQLDFNRVAFEQYFAEAAKLMTMAAEVTELCCKPLEARSLSALHDLNDR